MDNLLFKSGNSSPVNIDEAQGIVECFVAGIGNKDSVGDVVISGAFAKSLLRRKPRVVWGHSWNDPIGKVLEMYEVPVGDSRLPAKMRNAGIGGLYAKVQFNLNSEKGKEAFATVAFFGEDQEWSIGYKTIDSIFDQGLQANILKEVELYEVSPVLHGANQLTGTISIKGDEKGHMPIIPMSGMGMPMMAQAPRIVVVAAQQEDSDISSVGNPFAEGMSQELSEPEKNSLQSELAERTGSKIEVMNATENSVVFRRTTSNGQASMYRLPYHKEGNLYMFGKPEPYMAETPTPQTTQNIEQKPGAPVVVPNGGIAYRNDDQQEMVNMFAGENMVQSPWGKSEVSHLIELPEVYMSAARDYLNPVLRHHKLAGRPSSKGIIIDGLLTANALDALQNAVKALGTTIGQAGGNIGQAIGKIRDLAQTFNPYALDGDGDGFVQDGSAFQRPYVPIKKPGFDLPDVRGRKRNGDALLDKPRSAPKLPKDKNTWSRAQRNDALLAGVIEPETREDVSFLANRRPDNEGIAKYWDMSEADLTKEGNKLLNARKQSTGAKKDEIDQELLKVSHEFQRRASYAETFGQDFVPPAKQEVPKLDLVPIDITQNESIRRMLGAPKSKIPRTDEGFASRYAKYEEAFDTLAEQANDPFISWDKLDEDSQIEFVKELDYDYMYDVHGNLGDDGIVDALDDGVYDDEIAEFAGDVWDTIAQERKLAADKERRELDREEAEDPRALAEAEEAARIEREELEEERIERFRPTLAELAMEAEADEEIDAALERYVGELPFGDDDGLASRAPTARANKYPSKTEILMEIARRDGWRGGDRQPPVKSYRKTQEAIDDWDKLSEGERNELLNGKEEPTIKEVVDAMLEARNRRLAEVRSRQIERRNAERKARVAQERARNRFANGDASAVDRNKIAAALKLPVNNDETSPFYDPYARGYTQAVLDNWKEMSQADRYEAMQNYDTDVNDEDSLIETLNGALNDYGYKNPKIAKFLDSNQSDDDGFASRGRFGSNPEDSKAAQIFDAILDKYWKMWGFDVPDDDEDGQDEPFGFASRGNEEEVKQDKLDELVGGVRERLIAELETADPATWKPSWRNDSLPINPTTGKPYRGFNAFWLMLRARGENYKTGRYAGFNQLKARGAQVRKGEKGVPILRPQLMRVTDDDGNVKEFVRFRGTTVFNIDQTDGGDEALRAVPADLPEEQRIAILDTTIAELGVNVRTENTTPHYNPDEDYISMPEFAKGTSPIEWSSTLAHETVHWTGGAKRLNRPSVANYSSDRQTRAYEELVAEIGSAMLLAAHGIEAPFRQDHAPYIKGWLQLLKDDPDAMNRAFKDAQAALNHLLEKSPNLRKMFGGIENGKKAPEVDAPDLARAEVSSSDGFASLHRVRTPRSEALTGILYDDNTGELMVGFQKGKPWDKLSQEERENWIEKAEAASRDRGGLPRTNDIDAVAKDLYDDSRDTGWYVYSDVSMNEVQELAAARSKGKHINALKKLKTARKATDDDNFNFFGRDERVQDVGSSRINDGFASRNNNMTVERDPRTGYITVSAMVTGDRGASEENRGTRLMRTTSVGGSQTEAMKNFRDKMKKDRVSFAGESDGFASSGTREPLEGMRRHKLMPADIRSKLPELYSTEEVDTDDKMVVAKFFSPYSNWTWYAVEFDGDDTFFGYVEGFEGEWGNFSLSELANAQVSKLGVPAVERDTSFRPTKFSDLNKADGFASRGSKKLGIEPRFSDPEWIEKTQQRILKKNTDFSSLSHDDQVDWANSFLDEYLRQNEMGFELSDVANGRRSERRPDIELLNYAEEAYSRMSDSHMARRAQFGEEDGFASVGRRTRRLGIKPSEAVDYVSYDPETENLFVAYKREDGRGDMYVYEGVSMDDAIGVENAQSVGRAINDIKRRKNVRKATPEEVVGLSESEVAEGAALKKAKAIKTIDAIYGSKDHRENRNLQLEINADRISVNDDGTTTWESADDTMRYTISPTDDGGYSVTAEKISQGGREEPDTFETVFSTKENNREDAITALFNAAKMKIADDDAEAKLDRELDAAKRELDMAGDAPGVESLDVTYSTALDAVDYNPSTQELRVSYKDGGTYIYEGVDRAEFEEFKSAPSKGRAMNDVKRAHPFRKDTEWAGGDDDGGVEEFDVRGSEAVEKVSYDPETEDLLVVYTGGKGYVYTGVTRAEADAVRSAPSKGRAINDVKRTHEVRLLKGEDIRLFGGREGYDRLREARLEKDSERTAEVKDKPDFSASDIEQYKRIARSVADQIVNPEDEIVEDPAFDKRDRGNYFPEWSVVPDWLKKSHTEWMNENNPKSSGKYTMDEVGEIFNAQREILMNTGVKGPERKVTSGRRIPKSELDRFEKESMGGLDGLFDVMRKTYDSMLMSNDYDKEKANAEFREMFGDTIESVSDSSVLSGDVPIIDADGDRIDPQGYKIKPIGGFDMYERVVPVGSGAGTEVIDPAPAAKPKMPTRKPPRGGMRVRNRNVSISMEQGTLDEIMEAESKNITVDALRDAAGSPMGKYTKGPRKGKNRGYDTITVRNAETGELLHANEILLTSSASPGSPSAANRKRGYIRARSYAGRQGHNIVSDEGPSLRGEGKGMTDYDKRVYGLGSDEKNREIGLASTGGRVGERGNRISEDINDFRRYLDSEYGEYFMEYTQMDDEELKQTLMTRYRMSRGEARDLQRQIRRDEKYYYDLWEQEDSRLNDLDALGYSNDDGFASRMPNDGERLMRRANRDFTSDQFSPSEYRQAMSGLDKARNGSGEITDQENNAIRKLADLIRGNNARQTQIQAIDDVINNVNSYRSGQRDGFASRGPDQLRFMDLDKVQDWSDLSESDQEEWMYELESDGAFETGATPKEMRTIAEGAWEERAAERKKYVTDQIMRALDVFESGLKNESDRERGANLIDGSSFNLIRELINPERADVTDYREALKLLEDTRYRVNRYLDNRSRGSDEDGFASTSRQRYFDFDDTRLDAPVVRGEKSPIIDLAPFVTFDSFYGGGSKFSPRSERTYDIYGEVSMPIPQNELVYNTRFTDQIVKDFSRSDLTIDELADRFDVTPTQIQEVLLDAKNNIEWLEYLREKQASKYLTSGEESDIKQISKVEKLFAGDRKPADIPELTGEALAKQKQNAARKIAQEKNKKVDQERKAIFNKLKYTPEYQQAERAKALVERENESFRYWFSKRSGLKNATPNPDGTEDNLSILVGDGLYPDDVLEILKDAGIEEYRDPTDGWFEDDYGTLRDEYGENVDYADVLWEDYDVDLDSLSAEQRQKLSDEVESTKNFILKKAKEAREALGLPNKYNEKDIDKAMRLRVDAAEVPLDNLYMEAVKDFPYEDVPDEQKTSSMFGLVDSDGNKVDYETLPTQYNKRQDARIAAEKVQRAELDAELNRGDQNLEDGFASRSTGTSSSGPNRPLKTKFEWTKFEDLRADDQDEIIQDHIDSIDRVAQPDIDLEEEKNFAIEQWNEAAGEARSEAAEALLKEIYDLWDQDADADNIFQKNGNLAYAEELIKNTSYVEDLDIAYAQNIVDEVRERFEDRKRNSVDEELLETEDDGDDDGFASRGDGDGFQGMPEWFDQTSYEYPWDELSDEQQMDVMDAVGQTWVYEKLGMSDDEGIDYLESNVGSDGLKEYAEAEYNAAQEDRLARDIDALEATNESRLDGFASRGRRYSPDDEDEFYDGSDDGYDEARDAYLTGDGPPVTTRQRQEYEAERAQERADRRDSGFASRGGQQPVVPEEYQYSGLDKDELVEMLVNNDVDPDEAELIANFWANSDNLWDKYLDEATGDADGDVRRGLLNAAQDAYDDYLSASADRLDGFASRMARPKFESGKRSLYGDLGGIPEVRNQPKSVNAWELLAPSTGARGSQGNYKQWNVMIVKNPSGGYDVIKEWGRLEDIDASRDSRGMGGTKYGSTQKSYIARNVPSYSSARSLARGAVSEKLNSGKYRLTATNDKGDRTTRDMGPLGSSPDLVGAANSDGFASRGDDPEMRPYDEFTDEEKSKLYEVVLDDLIGQKDSTTIYNVLNEGGFDYDDYLQRNPETHPDFADFGDPGDMGQDGFASVMSNESLVSHKRGVGDDTYLDVLANFVVDEINNETGLADDVRGVILGELGGYTRNYLSEAEPGSEEFRILKGIVDGNGIDYDDYAKLPEGLLDDIDLLGNESGEYGDYLRERDREDQNVMYYPNNGFRSRGGSSLLPISEALRRSQPPDFTPEDKQKIQMRVRDTPEFQDLVEVQEILDGYVERGWKRSEMPELDKREIAANRALEDRRNYIIEQMIAKGEITRPQREENNQLDGFASRGFVEEIDVSGSTAVERVSYDPEKEELLVVYEGGNGYVYSGVTRNEVSGLKYAPSKGRAINDIKRTHDVEKLPFTPAQITDYPDDYETDIAYMAAQGLTDNFARLSEDDQNMYLQRALANNADSGMTTDQILGEARKLAMDDREMAQLERQAVGMGESSEPRKIDVSSSSALNYVAYDEKNRALEVEYRGRDGKGTGTVYRYQDVEPDLVDRIEAADSRGATLREVRDNYEFTTSRRLPDSAYEGLASRGSRRSTREMETEFIKLEESKSDLGRMDPSEVQKYRQKLIDARNQAALEMIQASGLDPKNIQYTDDASSDDDDYAILENYGLAIAEAERALDNLRSEKNVADAKQNAASRAWGAAQEAAKEVRNGSYERRRNWDSDEEYIQALRDDWDSIFGTVESFFGDDSEGRSMDDEETHTYQHDRYMFDDEKALLDGMQERINSAKTEEDFNKIGEDLDKLMTKAKNDFENLYREDEAFYDYDVSYVPDAGELPSSELTDFLKNQNADGFASRDVNGGTWAPGSMPEKSTTLNRNLIAQAKLGGNSQPLQDEIRAAMQANQSVRFSYNGKERNVIPISLNPSRAAEGRVNLVGQDSEGVEKNFSLDKMSASDDFENPLYPKDEVALQQFINQQELELDDYTELSKQDPIKYPPSGIEANKKRLATARRDLARIQKNKPQISEEEEFLDSIDGFASRGRRRPGRRRGRMAPVSRYSAEDRQNLADGNILRSRKRPGKRRQGPSVDEFDGFASRTIDDLPDTDVPFSDVPFEGGEHGPGKDISLKKMWQNYKEYNQRRGRNSNNDRWLSPNVTIDETAKFFGIDKNVAAKILQARDPRLPELFIDDPYLAQKINDKLGPDKTTLFGFDPSSYYDDDGNVITNLQIDEDLENAVMMERARRAARISAREGRRSGKGDVYRGESSAADVRELESALNIKLTDSDGNLLPPNRLKTIAQGAGINWGLEKWRRIQNRGGTLSPLDIQELVGMGIFGKDRLPQRGDLSFGEVFQWPGFLGIKRSDLIDALAETLGLSKDEILKQKRSIEEALSRAAKGRRKAISTRNLQSSKLKLTKNKIKELVERLGLDASEFDRWFGNE